MKITKKMIMTYIILANGIALIYIVASILSLLQGGDFIEVRFSEWQTILSPVLLVLPFLSVVIIISNVNDIVFSRVRSVKILKGIVNYGLFVALLFMMFSIGNIASNKAELEVSVTSETDLNRIESEGVIGDEVFTLEDNIRWKYELPYQLITVAIFSLLLPIVLVIRNWNDKVLVGKASYGD